MRSETLTTLFLGWFFAVAFAAAGQRQAAPAAVTSTESEASARGAGDRGPAGILRAYVLGPDDEILVRLLGAGEIESKPFRIGLSGHIRLPYVGRVKAAGLTVEQLEAELVQQYKKYFQEPDISVSITEFRSQPVSIIGAVKNPGVHQLAGRKTLVEMLSLAGGLDAAAGPSIKITRRLEWGRIPLQTASDDPSGQFSIAQISVRAIFEARSPEDNIAIQPFDIISVPRAAMVYVIGQVQRAGGFPLGQEETTTVLQALALAGGVDRAASPKNACILRNSTVKGSRSEIPVDISRILQGKTPDLPLNPEDILFIPSSAPKRAAIRAVEAAIQMGTGIVIWRR